MRADFRPCDNPAYISLTVYETSIGFSYNVGKVAAGPHRWTVSVNAHACHGSYGPTAPLSPLGVPCDTVPVVRARARTRVRASLA